MHLSAGPAPALRELTISSSGELSIWAAHKVVQAALVGASTLRASCSETSKQPPALVESSGRFAGSPHLAPLGVGPQPAGVGVFGYQPKV